MCVHKLTLYNFLVADCSCKELDGKLDKSGYCKFQTCYVNQPSNCSDLVDSITHPGEQKSSDACKRKKGILIVLYNLP